MCVFLCDQKGPTEGAHNVSSSHSAETWRLPAAMITRFLVAVVGLCLTAAWPALARPSDRVDASSAGRGIHPAAGELGFFRGGGGGGGNSRTTTGLERLCSSASFAKGVTGGRPTCILAHAASVLPDLTHAVDALADATKSGVNLVSVLAPEHGFRGAQQAGHGGKNATLDPRTGLQVFSIYTKSYDQILSLVQRDGCEVVLVDLQDCGARFYTYIWSMYDVLVAAAGARSGHGNGAPVKVVVLDRPNPLGGQRIEGPVLAEAFSSGVGKRPLSMRHGMTIGELANLFNEEYVGQEDYAGGSKAELTVVQMQNWSREMIFTDTGLPYVPPSPNLPTTDSVSLYLGLGLIEGVDLSEGRGTALPFQLIGAPYIGWEFADALRGLSLPGVRIREAYFAPVMSKYANQTCGGVEVTVGPPPCELDALRVALEVIKTAHDMFAGKAAPPAGGAGFSWVKTGSRYWIDLLTGNEMVRTGIESGLEVDQIVALWQKDLEWFKILATKYLLYT